MICHGLILNLFVIIHCWKVDEKQQRNTWHLECTKTLHLAPSVGVPGMPLLEKVNWWLINPIMCSFPCSLTFFSLFLSWQSLTHIDTPLHILACLITWHILAMYSHYLTHQGGEERCSPKVGRVRGRVRVAKGRSWSSSKSKIIMWGFKRMLHTLMVSLR